MTREADQRRVLVIGLDGGTFSVIDPLLREGRLPAIKRLMDEGSSGVLESTIPPHSSVAWPSFATGKNPGKHGVFYVLQPVAGTYRRELVSSRSVRARTIWELLSLRGRRVGVVDMPITFPPRPVNGFMIAGMLTPSEESSFTYPAWLHTELLIRLGDLPVEAAVVPEVARGGPLKGLKVLAQYTDNRLRAALHLMRRSEWDFFVVVFRGLDSIQHLMWRYMDDRLRSHHPSLSRKMGRAIVQFYERMDSAVAELMTEAGPQVTTVILSDHGMAPCRRHLFLNRWLEEEGLLRRKSFSSLRARRPCLRRRALASPLRPEVPAGRIRRWMGRSEVPVPGLQYLGRDAEVDWSRTRAYANWTGGEAMIYVNLRGREPRGIVSPGSEYEALCEKIRARLLELRDPADGKPVVERVFRREEIYQGPFVEEAPDLHLICRDFGYHARGEVRAPHVVEEAVERAPALHDLHGVLIMRGEGVRSGYKVEGARIIDLAPTIIHLMGLPVPDDMDGAVLGRTLEPSHLEAHPVTHEPAEAWAGEGETSFSSEEEDAVMDSLRGLGYVS